MLSLPCSLRRLRPGRSAVCLAVAGACLAGPARCDDLMGAARLLEALSKAAAATNDVAALSPAMQAHAALKADLRRFREGQAGLSPEQAAADWLALYERARTLPAVQGAEMDGIYGMEPDEMVDDDDSAGPVTLQSVVAAIPPPASWPAIEKAVNARAVGKGDLAASALRLVAAYLNSNTNALREELAAVGVAMKTMDPNRRMMASHALRCVRSAARAKLGGDAATAVVADIESALDAQQESGGGRMRLQLPDLVGLLGEARARALIERALATPGVGLQAGGGGATLRLAQTVCRQKVRDLKTPQWGLVVSPDDVDLYEALTAKFPAAPKRRLDEDLQSPDLVSVNAEGDSGEAAERLEATRFYVLGLVARGRIDDAVRVAGEALLVDDEQPFLSWHMRRRAHGPVPPGALYAFYEHMLTARPGLPLWTELVAAAPMAGKADEALALLASAGARADLTPVQRARIREAHADALLALDRVDEGVAIYRDMLKRISATNASTESVQRRMNLGRRMATVGHRLQRAEWVDEGLSAIADTLCPAAGTESAALLGRAYLLNGAVEVFLTCGRYGEAERLIQRGMQAALAHTPTREEAWFGGGDDGRSLAGFLVQLVVVYGEAGRHADVMMLLERAPWWGAADLADLVARGMSGGRRDLALAAAQGLHAAGRDAEAVAILKACVLRGDLADEGYRLLVDMAGADLIPWLDRIAARDRFEERPLIWKAYALMKAGRLDEAEKAAREALRVDPTDGEAPEGDRVRGYAVLGDILEARGRKDDANFFRRVVESVRIAEQGDRLTEAGLIRRSLALYDKAEASFADAYCVQWRLAERLYALGDTAGAEKHYRIAFERMPEQFGQVASLCFGCEGVFDGVQSRSVAETVLLRLETNGPPRPQVCYLLGQLREAQDRPQEACAYYRKALQRDPDYLDAWAKLDEVVDRTPVPPAERDAIRLKILSLDPLQRHHSADTAKVADLQGLWATLETAQARAVAPDGLRLDLTASRERIEEEARARGTAAAQAARLRRVMGGGLRNYGCRPQRPGEAIATHEFVMAAMQLVAQSRAMAGMEAFGDDIF